MPKQPQLNLFYHFQEKQYAQGKGFITRAINSCHTSSIPTPEDKEQAQKIHVSPLYRLLTKTTEAVDYWGRYNR